MYSMLAVESCRAAASYYIEPPAPSVLVQVAPLQPALGTCLCLLQ